MSRDYYKRDPVSHRSPADIARMDSTYNARPEIVKKRTQRNQARRIVEKRVGVAAMRGKDVDHIKPVRSGGTNAPSNLRLRSPHANRGWERGK